MPLLHRPALYYPHFEFENMRWLASVLLQFRQVRRIVPGELHLAEPREIRALRGVEVPGLGPMLLDEPLELRRPKQVRARLLDWIHARSPAELARLERHHVPGEVDGYQLPLGDFIASLRDDLFAHRLAWQPADISRADTIAMHPKLGEALISMIAVEVAERDQLDLVTSDPRIHRRMLGGPDETPGRDGAPSVAQLVIHHAVDLSEVSLADIAAAVRDGNDLQAVRVHAQRLACELGLGTCGLGERSVRVTELAWALRSEWQRYLRRLGSFGRIFVPRVVDASLEAELAATAAKVGGYGSLALACLGGGLAVGVMSVRGQAHDPNGMPRRYLSGLTGRGAVLVSDVLTDRLVGHSTSVGEGRGRGGDGVGGVPRRGLESLGAAPRAG